MTYHWEWRKSSRSATSGACVEVGASVDTAVMAVRDSKLADDSPILMFSRGEFAAFLDGVKLGRSA